MTGKTRMDKINRITELSACIICGNKRDDQNISSLWCYSCEDKILKLLIYGLRQSKRPDEADDILTGLVSGNPTPVLRYNLGLVKAENGDIEASIELFDELDGVLKEAIGFRSSYSRILASRASESINQKKYGDATSDLAFSVEMTPGNDLLETALVLSRSIDALLKSKQKTDGKSQEKSIFTLQEVQKADPDNYLICHNLGVISYRLACDSEEKKNGKLADSAWRNAIACWTLLLNTESFWTQWAERERNSYGLDISDEEIKLVRSQIRDRLLQDFRIYRMNYGESEDSKASNRHREYEVLFTLENKAASAIRRLREMLVKKDFLPALNINGGPLLLDRLGLDTEVQTMLEQARETKTGSAFIEEIENYFTPSGRIEILIDMSWLDQAENELDRLIGDTPSSNYSNQMQRVLKGIVDQMIAKKEFNEAITKLEKGFKICGSVKEFQKLAGAVFTGEARRLIDSASIEQMIDKVITVLDRGWKLAPENKEIENELADFYVQRAIYAGNKQNWAEAKKDIKNASKVDKNNRRVQQNAPVIYNNLAVEFANEAASLIKEGRTYQAREKLNTAIQIVDEGLEYIESDLLQKLRIELMQSK